MIKRDKTSDDIYLRDNADKAELLVRLLYEMAARIQDVVGLTLQEMLNSPKSDKGYLVQIKGKKTTNREAIITEETYQLIQNFKEKKKLKQSDFLFAPGENRGDPANIWVKFLTRYFNRHGIKIQTHDFRKSMATEIFNDTKDLKATGVYLGHQSMKTTERYIQVDKEKVSNCVSKIQTRRNK